MAFVEPITVKKAVEKVHDRKYVLPAIQREFVWDTDQIERLFDSLMRDYPIGSFLFWEVERGNIGQYQFYYLVQNYHERDNTHNPKADLKGENNVTAILDGQQRLTALYIGLKGTFAYKLPNKRWDNDASFPNRKLFINLLGPSNDLDMLYDFRFLTNQEAENRDEDHYWFNVGEILNLSEEADVNDYLIENDISVLEKEKFRFANRVLFKLHGIIHKDKSINIFLEEEQILDKVLNIFIRINSGGTQLDYSDLLLSIATAQWEEKDAREEITNFVDEINGLGDGFNINKDFVLKSCLVLSGFKNIAFKVDNFNQDNMLKIEKEWDSISDAIRTAFILLSSFGYHRDTLTSNNAVIPVAYYLKTIDNPNNYSEALRYRDDRKKIFKWLIIALLKRTFGGVPDNVLRPMREVIDSTSNGFPFDEIIKKQKGTTKSMSFDDDEIENLLYNKYGQTYTFSVLAFLYPTLDYRNKFHQDHIFPKKYFTAKRLKRRGIAGDKVDFYLDNYNYLANLQLLEGVPNQEKASKDFGTWLFETYPNISDRNVFMKKNYIPDIDLSLENFEEFVSEREKLIVSAFKKLLT